MATRLSVPAPKLDSKPGLTRSRSSSSPTATRDDDKDKRVTKPVRPTHYRSRSYISPSELQPTQSKTFPPAVEKPVEVSRFHRLHLPGRHHHNSTSNEESKHVPRAHHGRHKYTQSETQHYQRKKDSLLVINDSPGTPVIVTTPVSSSSELQPDVPYPSSRGTAIPSLKRMASNRSHRAVTASEIALMATLGDQRSGLVGRTVGEMRGSTNEPGHGQLHPTHPKSPIELQLEQADQFRKVAKENVSEADIRRKEERLQTATVELRDRLTQTTRSASDLMRRLDDAQDTLVRTTESLVDTISSFSNLSDQSSKLISNFTHESHHLDRETRQRIAKFRDSIRQDRSQRVDELEARGQTMSQKAEELGRRLENCRTIVRNWEEREISKRKAWRGVWVGIGWGVAALLVVCIAGIVGWKAVAVQRGGGTIDERLRHVTVHNKSYDVDLLGQLAVPDDVRDILLDINARVRDGRSSDRPTVANEVVTTDTNSQEDRSLRLLDEL